MIKSRRKFLRYILIFYASVKCIFPFITALEFTGGIPFEILQPVLERASPQQLITLEDYNSYLLEDTDVLWESHCKRDFKNKVSDENRLSFFPLSKTFFR